MKKKILMAIILIALFSPFSLKAQYKIDVKITDATDTVCYLAHHYGKHQRIVDTVDIMAGKQITFQGNKSLNGGIYMIVYPTPKGNILTEIMIDEDQEFAIEYKSSDHLNTMKIDGSELNTIYYQYMKDQLPIRKKINTYTQDFKRCQNSEDESLFVKNFNDSVFKANTPKLEPSKKKKKKKKKKGAVVEENPIVLDTISSCESLREMVIELNQQIVNQQDAIIAKYPDMFISTLFNMMKDVEIPASITDRKERFFYTRDHYFDNIDFTDKKILNTPIVEGKIVHWLDKMNYQMPDSIIVAVDKIMKLVPHDSTVFEYVLRKVSSKYEKSKIMCMDKVMVHIFRKYYITEKEEHGWDLHSGLPDNLRSWWFSDDTQKKVLEFVATHAHIQCGNAVQDLIMQDTEGRFHQLKKVNAKYTLALFWSATCGHCKKTVPKIKSLYDLLKQKENGFEVFAVCIDPINDDPVKRKVDPLNKFISKHQLDWINVQDDQNTNAFRTAYNVFSTPKLYLLDEDKKLIFKDFDIKVLAEFLSDKLGVELTDEVKDELGFNDLLDKDHDHDGHGHDHKH